MKKNTSMIIEMLKNWYFIDSVLLNDHAKYSIKEKKDYDEYVSLKAAVLSDLQEFYNYIGYSPKNNIPKNHKKIQESAREIAVQTKSISARMLENQDMMKHMKGVIKEQFEKNPKQDVSTLSDKVINERFIKMCIDNMLIGRPILKCEHTDKVSDFKSEILEQSYLTIRSELINIAKKYNNSFNNPIVNEGIGRLAAYGIMTVLGFSLAGSVARSIQGFYNRCNNRCGSLRLNTATKKVCELKCKVQTQQKIISSLRQSAAQTNNVVARNKFAKDVQRAQLRMTQYQRQLAELTAKNVGSDNLEPAERATAY